MAEEFDLSQSFREAERLQQEIEGILEHLEDVEDIATRQALLRMLRESEGELSKMAGELQSQANAMTVNTDKARELRDVLEEISGMQLELPAKINLELPEQPAAPPPLPGQEPDQTEDEGQRNMPARLQGPTQQAEQFGEALEKARQELGAFQPAEPTEQPHPSPRRRAQASMGGAMRNIQMFTGIAAVNAFAGVLTSAIGSIRSFVEAFSPGVVEQVMFAFRNLAASIGAILEPLMASFIGVFNVFNQVFTAMAEALRPVFAAFGGILEELATTVAGLLLPIMQAFAPIISAAVQQLQEMLTALRPVFVALGMVLEQYAQLILQLFQAMQPLWPYFLSAIQITAEALTYLAATTAELIERLRTFDLRQLLDFRGIFDDVRDRVDEAREGFDLPEGTTVAAGPSSFRSISDVARNAQLAALKVGTRESPEERSADHLQSIDETSEAILTFLRNAVSAVESTGEFASGFWDGATFRSTRESLWDMITGE